MVFVLFSLQKCKQCHSSSSLYIISSFYVNILMFLLIFYRSIWIPKTLFNGFPRDYSAVLSSIQSLSEGCFCLSPECGSVLRDGALLKALHKNVLRTKWLTKKRTTEESEKWDINVYKCGSHPASNNLCGWKGWAKDRSIQKGVKLGFFSWTLTGFVTRPQKVFPIPG